MSRRAFLGSLAGGLLAAALVGGGTHPTISATPAAISRDGVNDGAPYQIEIPANWNRGLVMFAHGYQGEGSGAGDLQGSPLSHFLAAHGYAWAASGYRGRGYRPDWFLADTLALRERVIREFGRPRWTIIHGQSMGGHVAIASLELHPEIYQGGLIECGIVDGVGLIDWLYAYTAAAEYLSGVRILDAPDRPTFMTLVNGSWLNAMGMPGSYTDRGRRFDSVVKYLLGGELPLRGKGMSHRYLMNLNSRDPGPDRAREFARHASTVHVRYRIDPGLGVDEETLNREVRRITPAAGARSRDKSSICRADRADPGAAAHHPRDGRLPGALPARARLPAAHDRGGDGAPARAAGGALGRPLRVRRRRAGACLRRPGDVGRAWDPAAGR